MSERHDGRDRWLRRRICRSHRSAIATTASMWSRLHHFEHLRGCIRLSPFDFGAGRRVDTAGIGYEFGGYDFASVVDEFRERRRCARAFAGGHGAGYDLFTKWFGVKDRIA